MTPLPLSFYLDADVVALGKALIGKLLFTQMNGEITGGRIIETESYAGIRDRASHAFGGRRTKRNEAMYSEGGVSYVYLCYGMHYLFNVVTNQKDTPHAVLIRAIDPLYGIEIMLKRRNKKATDKLAAGPGTLCQALAISLKHNQIPLNSSSLWISEEKGFSPPKILEGPRIGVDYAKEDALLPYRFRLDLG